MGTEECFYNLSKQFCDMVDTKVLSSSNTGVWMTLLMKLYAEALELPNVEPEKTLEGCEPACCPRSVIAVPADYWEIYDPLEPDEPVCGSLFDDLGDIYRELKSGTLEYEAGRTNNAIWEWKFGVDNHWGQHVVDAIRALHSIRTNA